jgi:hypothetical protein
MSKRHPVSLQQAITVSNEMSDYSNGMMRALVKKNTRCLEDLFFAVKFAGQKLCKYYTEVTPTTGMILTSAYILNHFWKL